MGFDIILCEGESDAILLGYYLKASKEWSYVINPYQNSLPCMAQNVPKSIEFWHKKDSRYMLIWAVNGNNFERPLDSILKYNDLVQTSEKVFTNICFVTDHDDSRTEDALKQKINGICSNYSIRFSECLCCNTWINTLPVSFKLSPEAVELSFFLTNIPDDEQGTMESFLLNCCSSHDATDRKVISQCNSFVDCLDCLVQDPAGKSYPKYMAKRGDRPKVKFSVFFSITNPRKVFCTGNEMLLSIPWENYSKFNRYFDTMISKL